LVIAPNDIFEEIQRFAKLLDEREEDIQLKVFPLKNAKSEELLAKFTQMTTQLMTTASRNGEAFQMDLFAASADPRTNSLVVMGKPATFVLVDTVIQQLDIPPVEDPNQIIKHFHLEKTQAGEIATAINNLFAGKDTAGVDPPKAEPNTNTNSVVVRGTLRQLEEIEKEIIKKLEAYVSPIQDKFKMHRFVVNHANVVELAEILTNHFTQKFNNLSTAGIAGLQPVDRTIGIMPDKTTSTLVVQASDTNLKELEELLKMYDTPELFGDDVRSVKLFALEYATPSYVVTAITQTYPTTPNMIEKDMIHAMLEPGTDAIIVTANEKNMVKVEELVAKIDIDRGTTRQTFFHDVKNVRPSDIASVLSNTVVSQRRKRNEIMPVIQPSDITNKLIITSTAREYEEMQNLIEQLDVEGAFAAGRVTKFYRPQFIEPTSLSSVISANLSAVGSQRPEDAIQVSVEPTTQVMLVTASEENHVKVEALIAELDLEESQGRVTEIFKLEHALPSEMVQLLNGTGVATQRRGVRDTIPLTFTPDPQRNTLVVNGTKRDVESVRGMIAKLDTPIDIQGGRRIEVYPIQFTDPQYVLTAVNALVNPTGRSTTPDEVINASLDYSSYSLIVSATPPNHERVAEIIFKMDQEGGGKEVQTVKLEHATPSAVIEMLTSVYSATRKTQRSGPPVTFIADAAHNAIILTGARREITDALELISQFDEAPDEGTGRTIEIYPVNYTSTSYVANAVTTLYPETRDTKPEDRVTVTIDSTTSTLIVSAIPKNHEKVAELLAKMDKEGEGKLTEIVPLQHATPTDVIRLMTQIYSTTRKQKITGDQVVNFIDDPAHNAIVLTGSQREIGKAKDLIAQFDLEPIAGAGRTIEVYPIKYTTPSYVENAITSLMNPTGRTKTPEDVVSVSIDHTSYSLIVSATVPNHAKIKEIIEKMDVESNVAKKTEIVKLKHATPTDVIQILTSVYTTTRKRTQTGEQPVNFIPDLSQNAIVMTGPAKEIEDATKLIERFDIPPDEGAGRTIKIYPIRYTSPSYAEQAINSLSAPVSGRQKKPEDLIQITVDHSNYALIISATPKMHEKIDDLLSQMDIESDRTDNIELVRLEYATPDDVITMLQGVYGATRRTTQRGEKPVTFLPDPMHNGVVLTGPPHEIEDARTLIAKFDTPPEVGTDRRIEVYPIHFTSPSYVLSAVESLLNPTGRNVKTEDRVTASIDSVTNSLIVSATAKNHEKVAEVIMKMDQEGEMVKDTAIVPLEHTSPQDVINLLTSVYQTTRRRSQMGEQPVNFVPDVAHNAIVLTGTRKEIASAKDLIQKFDTPADADAGITLEVYPVKYANPSYVQQAISNLFASSSRTRIPEEMVNVTVEHSTYSLIVSASAKNHEKIVELLAKVDKEGEGKVTEFVELKEAVPADVITVLSTVYQTTRKTSQSGERPVNFIEDTAHNAIVLTGSQVEVDKAKVLIAKLDLPPLDDLGRTIKVHRVEFVPPSTIQNLVQNTMAAKGRVAPEERVDVTADPTTGTVIVYANARNHEKIDNLIGELDREGESKDVVEIIELVNARAADVATTLTQMLSSTRQMDRKGNLPITVIPNVATNSLVISGPKFEFEAIKPLLAQLDVKPSVDVELNLRTYPLRYATAATLVSVIQTAFPSRSVSSPRDQVMVTSDPTTNTLIVQASGENHDRIGEMLDELDVSGAGNRKTQVIPIEIADPEDVATALNGIFEDQVRSRGTNQKMTIIHPEGTRNIVVTATEREFEEVFEILKDLDVDATASTDVVTIKLNHISANDARSLLQDYLRKPGQGGGSGELVGNVKIIPLEATQTLLLSGDEKQLANIEGLIQRIDIEVPKGGPGESRITKVIPVANADAGAVSDFISQSTRRSGNIPDIERVDISFDPGTRSVIVMAKKSRVEDIEKLIAELDKNSERTAKVERIRLKHALAEDLEDVLEDLFESGGRRGRENANPIQIEADSNSNSLLVSAIPSDMEKIRELIAELDTADQEGAPKILKLEHAEASQVVSVLTRIFAETRGRERGGNDDAPVIEAMDTSKSIIVRAKQNDLSMIEEMVKKLDNETDVGIATVKVIPMDESVDVVSLAEELESIINEGEENMVSASGSNLKPRLVSVQGDARTNSLLVAGAPAQFSVVEQLAKKLEAMGPRGPKQIRIINLKNVGSEDVRDVIEQLIEQQNSSSSPRRTGFRRRSRS
jgi:type II secretory pathway component GspD/PulD (secretin)